MITIAQRIEEDGIGSAAAPHRVRPGSLWDRLMPCEQVSQAYGAPRLNSWRASIRRQVGAQHLDVCARTEHL